MMRSLSSELRRPNVGPPLTAGAAELPLVALRAVGLVAGGDDEGEASAMRLAGSER